MDTLVSIIDSKGVIKMMKMKKNMALVLMGVGGTLLYQQIRNGNAKKYIKDMECLVKKTYNSMCEEIEDDLEDMM